MAPRKPLTVSSPGGKLVDSSLVILNCHSQLTVHLRPGLGVYKAYGSSWGNVRLWGVGLENLECQDFRV